MMYLTADNKALAFLKSLPTREQFLHRAGVCQNSYAGELMIDLYQDIFVYSKNLREEYLKYYKIEYSKFSAFAEAFSSMPVSVMFKMDEYFESYCFIIHFFVPGYLQEESGLKTLSHILNTKLAK